MSNEKKPHELANMHRILVEALLRGLTKTIFDGEDIENENWGDLLVGPEAIEIKQLGHTSGGALIRASQLYNHLNESDRPFHITGCRYVVYRYQNRDTHRPKPGKKRHTHLYRCRNAKTTVSVMSAHLRDCFIIHPLLLEALLKDQGLTTKTCLNFGNPTLVLSGQTVLEPLKSDDPCPLLKRLGLKPKQWEHIKTNVSVPFSSIAHENEALLPLTFNVPIYEIVPSRFDPLSDDIVRGYIV